jgi:hypothetical protein
MPSRSTGLPTWADEAGFIDTLFVPELPDVLEPSLGKYWQSSRDLMSRSLGDIERLDAMLGDDTSRRILAALVRYRITGRPEHHPAVDIEHHYLPVDLPCRAGRSALSTAAPFRATWSSAPLQQALSC